MEASIFDLLSEVVLRGIFWTASRGPHIDRGCSPRLPLEGLASPSWTPPGCLRCGPPPPSSPRPEPPLRTPPRLLWRAIVEPHGRDRGLQFRRFRGRDTFCVIALRILAPTRLFLIRDRAYHEPSNAIQKGQFFLISRAFRGSEISTSRRRRRLIVGAYRDSSIIALMRRFCLIDRSYLRSFMISLWGRPRIISRLSRGSNILTSRRQSRSVACVYHRPDIITPKRRLRVGCRAYHWSNVITPIGGLVSLLARNVARI